MSGIKRLKSSRKFSAWIDPFVTNREAQSRSDEIEHDRIGSRPTWEDDVKNHHVESSSSSQQLVFVQFTDKSSDRPIEEWLDDNECADYQDLETLGLVADACYDAASSPAWEVDLDRLDDSSVTSTQCISTEPSNRDNETDSSEILSEARYSKTRDPVRLAGLDSCDEANRTILQNSKASQKPFILPKPVDHQISGELTYPALPNSLLTRSKFPQQVVHMPMIPGLAHTTMLRTCFSICTARRVITEALSSDTSVRIELLARVRASRREQDIQWFEFGDLAKSKDVLLGYSTAWKENALLDQDAGVFIGSHGRLCRLLGIPEHSGDANIVIHVLSIWECEWEEILLAKDMVVVG